MPATDRTPLTVYLSAHDAERVRDLAAAADRSIAAEIRHAIRQYLEKSESLSGRGNDRESESRYEHHA